MFMNKKIFLFFPILIFMLSGCKDNNPVDEHSPCPPIDIVPEPSYNSPVWHPSGKFIGFNHTPLQSITYPYGKGCLGEQHFRRDSTGFWLINPDGTNMHRIFPYTLQTPAWSPDGNWIAFVAGAQIYKMKFTGSTFDTTTLVQLTTEGRNFFPAWSPDGQWIVFDSNSDSPNGMNFIWKMKANGLAKKRIAYNPSEGEIRMPNWSPNSQNIVHIRYLIDVFSSEIFVMDSNGTNPIRLTFNNTTDNYPIYSPNGVKIAFTSQSNGGQPQIWIMNSDASNKSQLTVTGVDASFGRPFSWRPDGQYIVYTDYRSDDWTYDNGTLWMLNPVTGGKKQLTFNIKTTK